MADAVDPGKEADEALAALDRRIEGLREAGRGPRRPRWFEVAVPVMLLLVGATLIYLARVIYGLPIPLFLVLALVALAPGVLLLLVGLRSLARMVAALLATEAEVPQRGEDGESGRGAP